MSGAKLTLVHLRHTYLIVIPTEWSEILFLNEGAWDCAENVSLPFRLWFSPLTDSLSVNVMGLDVLSLQTHCSGLRSYGWGRRNEHQSRGGEMW